MSSYKNECWPMKKRGLDFTKMEIYRRPKRNRFVGKRKLGVEALTVIEPSFIVITGVQPKLVKSSKFVLSISNGVIGLYQCFGKILLDDQGLFLSKQKNIGFKDLQIQSQFTFTDAKGIRSLGLGWYNRLSLHYRQKRDLGVSDYSLKSTQERV
ncbi:hypothetical protein BY458DRAFT_494631 [Sporodiniella umbellata]|nr:hypothetical protein BY458DRAFT_494631 [Sporodiniella umbellata]